jgi:hypothetical protein
MVDPGTSLGWTEVGITSLDRYGADKLRNLCRQAGQLMTENPPIAVIKGLPIPPPSRDPELGRWIIFVAQADQRRVELLVVPAGDEQPERSFHGRISALAAASELAIDGVLREMGTSKVDATEAQRPGTAIGQEVITVGAASQAVSDEIPPTELGALEKCLALLVVHPDWTDTKIALNAGVNRTTLYKQSFERFRQARAQLKPSLPMGSKSDGIVEAIDDSSLSDTERRRLRSGRH